MQSTKPSLYILHPLKLGKWGVLLPAERMESVLVCGRGGPEHLCWGLGPDAALS